MKKIKFYTLVLIFIFITNCGFKVVDKSKLVDFKIVEVSTTGEKRINYRIKNKLLINFNDTSKKILQIDLDTKKSKDIKEKNIKNEITKYNLKIVTSIKVKKINSYKEESFTVIKAGSYKVSGQYSATLNNEKKLIKSLTDQIVDEIFDIIILKTNAL